MFVREQHFLFPAVKLSADVDMPFLLAGPQPLIRTYPERYPINSRNGSSRADVYIKTSVANNVLIKYISESDSLPYSTFSFVWDYEPLPRHPCHFLDNARNGVYR
jgi:hypothetical protein